MPTTPATATATAAPAAGRLPNGELRRMVAAALAAAPAREHSPREIASGLGRSSGAVGNALESLTAAGHAERTSAAPRRYRATATTATAATPTAATPAPAAPATPPAPAAPKAAKPARRTKKTTTPAAPARTGNTVARPNGQDYHLRKLAGRADVDVLRTMRAAEVPVLLYGPPGTGKTSLIEAAYGEDLLTVQGDGDTTVADFVGEYTQTPDGRFVFMDGPLVRAMKEGRVLFIDDATLISPTVLAAVYPAMDGRKELVVKATGEVVKAEPGFFVVAGHNPGVHGAILSDALSSRFAFQVRVVSDLDLATQLGVERRAVKVARELAARQAKGEVGWAPQLRELLAFRKIAAATDPDTAMANLLGAAPEEDREVVAAVMRTVCGTTHTPLALGPRL